MSTSSTALPLAERRRLGRYYTSDDVADHMARSTIAPLLLARSGWPSDPWRLITDNSDPLKVLIEWLGTVRDRDTVRHFWDHLRTFTILDPTCGDGAFLCAAQRVVDSLHRAGSAALQRVGLKTSRLLGSNLYGVDLCPAAVAACQQALPTARLHAGNALSDDTTFSWQRMFPEVLARGGFDILLGNPPFLEMRQVDYVPHGFALETTGAVHALLVERALQLLHRDGALSLILPLSLVSTQRMRPVQQMLETARSVWYANFSWRPAKLFADVNRALTIVTAAPGQQTWTTGYQQWRSRDRAGLLQRIRYTEVSRPRPTAWVPKVSCALERQLVARWLALPGRVQDYLGASDLSTNRLYYRCDGGLYWKVFTDFAPAFSVQGRTCASTRQTSIAVRDPAWVLPLIGALSSDLFWWWYVVSSNCRHLNPSDLHGFPLPPSVLEDEAIGRAARAYLDDVTRHSQMKTRRQRQTGETQTQSFVIRHSRPLIEQLDNLLAPHYGLSAEELHFIKHFDLRFRLAQTQST